MVKDNALLPSLRRPAVAVRAPQMQTEPVVLSRPESSLTRDEQRVARETRLQLAVMDGQLIKAGYAVQQVHDIHVAGNYAFHRGTGAMLGSTDQTLNEEHKVIHTLHTKLQLEQFSEDLFTVMGAAIRRISDEVGRELYPEDEERGWVHTTYKKAFG